MPKYAHLKVDGGIASNVEYHDKVLYRANFFKLSFWFFVVVFCFKSLKIGFDADLLKGLIQQYCWH